MFTNCTANKIPKGRLEVETQFGYNGTVKISTGNPLVATIKNNGPAFEGELQIEVEDSMMSKVIIAQPFEIAENATKEIAIDVPLYIIQKSFKVNVTSKEKKLYEETIKASKVLSPDRRVMAVVTDTPDAYRFLENTKISGGYVDPGMYKYAQSQYGGSMVTTQETTTLELQNLEVLFFDSFDQLDSAEKLGFFNFIYIGHNQSLSISEEVENNLQKWMTAGNALVIETGADYKKTSSVLPESLNPIEISGIENKQIKNLWYSLPLDDAIDLATTNAINSIDTAIIEFEGTKVGAKTTVGNGSVITLFVNMALEPIASWNSKAPFVEAILGTYAINSNYQAIDPYYVSQFQYLVQQVPSDKQPPYIFMVIILGIYIFLVAPVAYFVLKKMDKRDFAWIGIPLLAVVCVITMYTFGLGTRHNNAIMNSISVLTAKEEESFMNVTSDIMIFNNERNKLKIEWSNNENLKLNNVQMDAYYMYNADPNAGKTEKKITGKITRGNTNIYEKYNAGLWGSTYISGDKKIPFETKKMIKMKIIDDKVSISVTNTTPYELKDAFIQWGMGNIFIGDLAPGEEKSIDQEISKSLYVNFETFLDKEMGLKPFDYMNPPTKEQQKDNRRFEILLQRYVYYNQQYMPTGSSNNNIDEVKLCAMNYQDVGYEIKVNDQETEDFVTNIIEITTKIAFDKGAEVRIPKGIVSPTVLYYLDDKYINIGTYEYQSYDQYYRLYEQGILEFDYQIPFGMEVSKVQIELGEVFNEQDYYNIANGQAATPKKDIKYKIFNAKDSIWEEIDRKLVITDSKYIRDDGHILFRADVRGDQGEYSYAQMMKAPSISIEGRVK
jgi:hypothetical protein